jgi:hypothetical protein
MPSCLLLKTANLKHAIQRVGAFYSERNLSAEEQGAEENIWMKEAGFKRRLVQTA